jgi:hypothetical protein
MTKFRIDQGRRAVEVPVLWIIGGIVLFHQSHAGVIDVKAVSVAWNPPEAQREQSFAFRPSCESAPV